MLNIAATSVSCRRKTAERGWVGCGSPRRGSFPQRRPIARYYDLVHGKPFCNFGQISRDAPFAASCFDDPYLVTVLATPAEGSPQA